MSRHNKSIGRWSDFYDYGIRFLTGESDPYNLRGLCDLTEEGKEIIQRFLGTKSIEFYENWNSGAVASCLLPYGILRDLATFIFFSVENADMIVDDGQRLYMSDYAEKYTNVVGFRVIHNPNKERKERNVHQFTGRTV